jgi:nitrite reductase/ring-hydroxylating ferredoxin subunit
MKSNQLLHRRDFVKTFALFSACSCLGGKQLTSLFVADVAAQDAGGIGIFRISLDNFAALKNDFGSVRLRVTGMPTSFSQIIVTRVPDNQFFAVTSKCTHEGVMVNAYSANLGAIRCPQHGSLFSPDGEVIQGPAGSALERYNTTFDGVKTVAIEIPGLAYSVTIAAATSSIPGESRVQLEFPTLRNLRYEARFRASLTEGSWAQVPFATTPDGAATQTSLTGTGNPATIFVAGTASQGFYAITRS